ncbi:MAG: threonine/serine exporter [Caldilineae bacterium]|nr:MAG: threonine/serine exporter [Caldilineae bacterium]
MQARNPHLGKPPLSREALRDVIDLSLWAGQLLLQYGADAQRVEETVHRFGTALGCDWMDILVSPNGLFVSTISGEEFRTKIRRVVHLGVDMTKVSAINRLSRRVEAGELDRHQARTELERITKLAPHYPAWLVVVMVGLACAAFSRLFGGDWTVFGVTFGASAVAMALRQQLTRRFVHPLFMVILTALTAAGLVGGAARLGWQGDVQIALAASVLLLVPGVPLINAAEDLIQGHMVIGLARGVNGALIALSIALGLWLAIQLTGVSGL